MARQETSVRFHIGRFVRGKTATLTGRVVETARELRRRARLASCVLREVRDLLRAGAGEHGTSGDPTGGSGRATKIERNLAVGPRTLAVVEVMAEVLTRSGYRDVQADAPGYLPPDVVRGTVRSHRPSLAAVGGGRRVFVDVYLPGETGRDEQLSRWHLFASAADQVEGEFHAVVPAFLDGTAGREWVRQLTETTGIGVSKVWEI